MKIWRIRYSDRSSRLHSLYQEQDSKPTPAEALIIVERQLLDYREGNHQAVSRNFVLGIQVTDIEEISSGRM